MYLASSDIQVAALEINQITSLIIIALPKLCDYNYIASTVIIITLHQLCDYNYIVSSV